MGSTLFSISYIGLWLIVLFQTSVLIGIIRRVSPNVHLADGGFMSRVNPLPHDSAAPEFTTVALANNESVSSARDLSGRRTLLGFVTPGCGQCLDAISSAVPVARNYAARLVVLCGGTAKPCTEHFISRPGGDEDEPLLLLDEDRAIANLYGVNGTPVFVLINQDWRIERYGAPDDSGELRQPAQAEEPTVADQSDLVHGGSET